MKETMKNKDNGSGKNTKRILFNPFERIAGWQALGWGLAGMMVSVVLCWLTDYHYHGLLHYGPASNDAWWTYAVEHVVVWLIPAVIFYVGGLLFSRSHIRAVDVLGTTLFAQLPLIFSTLITAVPTMQELANQKTVEKLIEQLQGINLSIIIVCALLLIIVIILMVIWLFNAVKTSCNLKGWRLWTVYLTAMLIGDAITRMIIGVMHV